MRIKAILLLLCLALLLPFVGADTVLSAGSSGTSCDAAGAPLKIISSGIYNLTGAGHTPPDGVPCLIITSSDVVVDFGGNFVTGSSAVGHYGIIVNKTAGDGDQRNVTIRNVTITNFSASDGNAISLGAKNSFAGTSWSNFGVLIENVTFKNSSIGINLTTKEASFVNVSNNVFLNLSSAGFLQGNKSSVLNNSWFAFNNFTDNNFNALPITFKLTNASNVTIFNNTFMNSSTPLYLANLTLSNVSFNNITGVHCTGKCVAIELFQSNPALTAIGHSNIVSNNWLLVSPASGSVAVVGILVNTSNNSITRNVIDSFSAGVNLTDGFASASNVTHNVIRNVWWGVGQAINVSNASTGNILIFNNTITNVSEGIVVDPGNATYNVSSNVISNVTAREGILFLDAPGSNATVIVWNNTVVNVTNVNLGIGIDLLRLNSSGVPPQVIFNQVNNTGKYGIAVSANKTNVSNNVVNFSRVFGVLVDQFNNNGPWNVTVRYNTLFSNNFSINISNSAYPNVSFNTVNLTLNGSAIYVGNGAINGTVLNNSLHRTNYTTSGTTSLVGALWALGVNDVVLNVVNTTFGTYAGGIVPNAGTLVWKNTVDSTSSVGIEPCCAGSTSNITNNTVLNSNYYGISPAGGVTDANVIVNSAQDGIYFNGNGATNLTNNVINTTSSNGYFAIYAINSSDGYIYSNTIIGPWTAGIVIRNSTSFTLDKLTISGVNFGVFFNVSNGSLSNSNASALNTTLKFSNSNGTLYNNSINYSNVSFPENTYSRFLALHPVNVSVYAGSLSSPFNGSSTTVNVTVLNSTSKQLNSSTAVNATGSILFNATVYEFFATSAASASLNHTSHTFGASVSGYDSGSNVSILPTGVFEAVRQLSIVLTASSSGGGSGSGGGAGGGGSGNDTGSGGDPGTGSGGGSGSGTGSGGSGSGGGSVGSGNDTGLGGNGSTGGNGTVGGGGAGGGGIGFDPSLFVGLSVLLLIILLILGITKMRGLW